MKGARRRAEDEANRRFLGHADGALVDAFWAGDRPANWPWGLPFAADADAVVIPVTRPRRRYERQA